MNPSCLLLSDEMDRANGAEIDAIAADCARGLQRLPLSAVDADPARLAAVTGAWYSRDLFTGGGPTTPSPATLRFFERADAAPRLAWLHVMSAGTDLPMYRRAHERGVRLTTSTGVTAVPIAQTAVAAVLAHARGFPGWLDAQRRGDWAPRYGAASPADLGGQTAVIVGLGPIGLEIARLLRAVGLHTIGVRQREEACEGVDETRVYADLDALLPRCDWLILCCPLTPLTHGLVDAARLAQLPAHARVINVGRGPVLQEAALVDAIRAGRLAGAYLDVFEHEPLPADSPLWTLPGVWLSPHNSASSQGNPARDVQRFMQALRGWLQAG
jgi:phosphoglycerate dehydrogenase-like enzyme